MVKRSVSHHSSIVIVRAKDLFFFNGYDSSYPTKEYVGFLNPLGGNQDKKDLSPSDTLNREVDEELTDPGGEHEDFATEEADALRGDILAKTIPYQDFVILNPLIERNMSHSEGKRSAIVSVYEAHILFDLMKMAQDVLKANRRLTSEGDGGNVISLDDLLSGPRFLAYANPFMLTHYLKKPVPYAREGKAEPIGLPRRSFEDYIEEFDYLKPVNSR